MRNRLVRIAGSASRALSGRRALGVHASGGVRLATRHLASRGVYPYRNHYGHLMEADLSDYIERSGFFGVHSPELFRYVNSCLRPGDWVIDAGANVGLVTSAMAARVGQSGSVWAIEPLPRNVERLRRLRAANGLEQLRVFPVALGAARSRADLRLPEAPGGSAFGSFVATWPSSGVVEVETVPLDDLVAEDQPAQQLRLIKLDVEGFEVEVVRGAAKTLATLHPLVLCEIHDPLLRAAGSSADQLVEAFQELGYVPIPPFGRPPDPLEGVITDVLFAYRDT